MSIDFEDRKKESRYMSVTKRAHPAVRVKDRELTDAIIWTTGQGLPRNKEGKRAMQFLPFFQRPLRARSIEGTKETRSHACLCDNMRTFTQRTNCSKEIKAMEGMKKTTKE
mmetsp:Transcript_30526/g.60013  ORF Transcript_30526/g.60013 Transcript_30526/m.60013 type:complete len:111 (+) Transcript_30526:238-570(+)